MRSLFIFCTLLISTSVFSAEDSKRTVFAECSPKTDLIEKSQCVDSVIEREGHAAFMKCANEVRKKNQDNYEECDEKSDRAENHFRPLANTLLEKEKFAQIFLKGDNYLKVCKIAKGKEILKEADCLKALKGASLGKTEVQFCEGELDAGMKALCFVEIANKQYLLNDLKICTIDIVKSSVPRGLCLGNMLQIPIAATPVKEIKPCPTYVKGSHIQCKEGKYLFQGDTTTSPYLDITDRLLKNTNDSARGDGKKPETLEEIKAVEQTQKQ